MSIVTLLTDFGYDDPYVGIVKASLLSINPSIQIVDITHSVPPQDIARAAFILGTSYNHFPKDTIHVIVVDPTVGSKRKIILLKTSHYYFLAPDNGVLSIILEKEVIEEVVM